MMSIVMAIYAGRSALIIGNSSYTDSPLKNPVNDVRAVERTLKNLGFSTSMYTNLDRRAFEEAIDTFVGEIRPGDEIVFYYSGHGAQIEGENFMIPVGKVLSSEIDVKYEAVSANKATEKLGKAGLSLIILDACRDNPYRGARSGTKGLATMQVRSSGQYVIYSTASGQVAADGAGAEALSPFTKAFIEHAPTPGLSIEEMMRNVTRDVKKASGDRQIPFAYGSLDSAYYLAAAPTAADRRVVSQPRDQEQRTEIELLTGDLRITADFETDIWLNMEKKGNLKPGTAINLRNLSVGTHVIEYFHGNAKYGYPVTVIENDIVSLSLKRNLLNPHKYAALNIYSNPSPCVLKIEGYEGLQFQTPFTIYDPERKAYKLKFSRDRYEPASLEISSNPSQTVERVQSLKPTFASISINSQPGSSKVFINGEFAGNTPLTFGEEKALKPGLYKIKVEPGSRDFAAVEKDIQLGANTAHQETIDHPFTGAQLAIKADYYPIAVYLNGSRNSALESGQKIRITGYEGDKVKQTSFTDRGGKTQIMNGYQCHLMVEYMGKELPYHKSFITILDLKAKDDRLLDIQLRIPLRGVAISSDQKKAEYKVRALDTDQSSTLKGSGTLELPAGGYTVLASSWGHYSKNVPLNLQPGSGIYEQKISFEPLPKRMTQGYKTWGMAKNGSYLGAALTLGYTALAFLGAEAAYKDYKDAQTPVETLAKREKFLSAQSSFNTSVYFNIVPVVSYIVSTLQQKSYLRQINSETNRKLDQ